MAYVLPSMPSTFAYWQRATWDATWPGSIAVPDLTGVPCQLRPGDRKLYQKGDLINFSANYELVCPAGTDIRGPVYVLGTSTYAIPNIVELNPGSGMYFYMFGVVDVAKDFGNEYRVGVLQATYGTEGNYYSAYAGWPWVPNWPVPYP